jgi:hypothetical protein
MQNTPQQTNGWTCGLHMLLINLTTTYQGRIPTLIHTQHHAESLSRSHLKYVLTGELDTYVSSLIHYLTNLSQQMPRTYHTRKKMHTQPITTTHNKHMSLYLHQNPPAKEHTLSLIPRLFPNPPTSPQLKTYLKRHQPTHRFAHKTYNTHSP